jgi:phosphoenolpyruvate-protein kinase (PTS system EI component)
MKFEFRKRIFGFALIAAIIAHTAPVLAAAVTLEGVIDKVVPEKTEIYVLADGKRHELYFNEKTEVTQAGQKVAFAILKKSQKVKVTADKVGKRLDPIKVEVLE